MSRTKNHPVDEEAELFSKLAEREFQCASLREKLNQVEALKGELEGSWKLASAQLVQRDADVADALGYLRTELEARNARVAVLERLQQGLAESRGQAAGAAASASEAAQATAAAHAAELAAIHDKLAAAEQFLAERDQLQAALQAAREQAETEKKEHHKRQMAAERKQAQDRELWKKDTEKAVLSARKEMVAQTDERLDSTIKRAILDNESMSQELTWQSRQAQRLVGHNQELERQMTQMRVALGVAKQVEEALVAKNQACERTIAMLLARAEALEGHRSVEAVAALEAHQDVEHLREELATVLASVKERGEQISDLTRQLDDKRNECRELRASYGDAAAFLATCITDARQRLLAQGGGGDRQPGGQAGGQRPDPSASAASGAGGAQRLALHELPLSQREVLLRGLLEQLHVQWEDKEGLILRASSSTVTSSPPQPAAKGVTVGGAGAEAWAQAAGGTGSATAAASAAATTDSSSFLEATMRTLPGGAGEVGAGSGDSANPHLLKALLSGVRPWGPRATAASSGPSDLSFPGSANVAQATTPRLGH